MKSTVDVDEDEAVILRSRPEARRALMDVTLGEADNIDADSIGDVVERVRGALEGRLREELDMTQTERDQALLEAEQAQAGVAQVKSQKAQEVQLLRDRVDDLEQRQAEQERRIEKRCQRRAAQYLYAIVGLFALALVTPAALQESAPATVAGLPSFVRIAALAGGGAIFFLAALRHFYGGSLKDWLRPLEARFAKWIERRARKRAGLFPAA